MDAQPTVDTDDDFAGWIGRRAALDQHRTSKVAITLNDATTITGQMVAVARPSGRSDKHCGIAVVWTGGLVAEHVAVDLDDVRAVTAEANPPYTTDSRAVWRVAGALAHWADQRRGKKLTELPPQDLGEGLGMARAFACVTQLESFGGQGEQYEGDLAFLADAVAYARQVDASFRTWLDDQTSQPVDLPASRPAGEERR